MKPIEIAKKLTIQVDTVNRVLSMMQKSEHKRQPPPIAKISMPKKQ
jgi:NH3-dependent NAD+ synthetase